MPKSSGRSKSTGKRKGLRQSGPILIARERPFASSVAAAFVLLFVAVGGYILFGSSFASGAPIVRLAIDGGKYCLDDYGQAVGRPGNPAIADIYTCNGSKAQQWTTTGGLIKINGQCLDVYQQKTATGTRVDWFPCKTGAANQQWRPGSKGEVIAVAATAAQKKNMCLDDPAFETTPGRSLDLWPCNGGLNENWNFTYLDSGASGNCASPYGNKAAGTPTASTAQCWGKSEAAGYGWSTGSNWTSLVNIWNRESGWRWDAENASGAYGIPQSLPGGKMSSAGSDWSYDAATQIKWGLGYIKSVYKTPDNAWAFELANGYY